MLRLLTFIVLAMIAQSGVGRAESPIDLAGQWRLALDDKDIGVEQQWFMANSKAPFSRAVAMPASLAVQEIGDPPTLDTPWVGDWEVSGFRGEARFAPYRAPHELKLPFWLTPTSYYSGPAWFRRQITVPDNWAGRRVLLSLERCHWTTTVWLDGQLVGRGESLATPHEFDLTKAATPGKHELVIRVDNRQNLNVGPNSHSVSDHTQGNWNGVVGAIELRSTPKVWIERIRLNLDSKAKKITAQIQMGNLTGETARGSLTVMVAPRGEPDAAPRETATALTVEPGGSPATLQVELGDDCQLWDEFNPALYTATTRWQPQGTQKAVSHMLTTQFGMREVSVEGTQITVNHQQRFLRGTLDCCVFPLTGHPPMDIESWRRVLQTCKDHGLNHIRFHSYCPPEAAFVAADELGFYLQIECSSWANQGATVGNGPPLDPYLYREGERILEAYGNHPSFVLMAYGNEPAGKNQNQFLTTWIRHFRDLDPRRLYTGGSGWPSIQENEYFVDLAPRIQGWGQELKSRINAAAPETTTDYRKIIQRSPMPIISHEIGQWCVFPNFEEVKKYTGHLKAKNLEIFAAWLAEAGLTDQAQQFLMASGELQVLCYKEDIESALRTPGMGGFQLLGLSDFSGQGTALVGVLDAFWEPKEYVTAAEFRQFCGAVVPLARLPKRTFTRDETFSVKVELANFGSQALPSAQLRWRLIDTSDGSLVAEGTLSGTAPISKLSPIGEIEAPLSSLKRATKLQLVVALAGADVENSWDLWCYPAESPAAPPEVYVTTALDQATKDRLKAGGKVLYVVPARQVKTDQQLGFSSIFWNTAWTQRQAPHTLGVLCEPSHPAFSEFPTDFHSNWQWWALINGGAAMDLTESCPEVEPIVQVVPDWSSPRLLALAFEAQVGGGKLLMTSANLLEDQANRPSARQFKTSLLNYMTGDRFSPSATLRIDQVESLIVHDKAQE